MADMKILRSGELMVAGVSGETEEGVEFIDSFFPKRKGANLTVLDSGRILMELRDLDELLAEARAGGLECAVEEGL